MKTSNLKLLFLALATTIGFASCSGKKKTDPEKDSLQKQVLVLKEMLAKKLIDSCNTTTTMDQKIKLQEYEDFEAVETVHKDSIVDALLLKKDSAITFVRKVKEALLIKNSNEEQKAIEPVLRSWEKKEPSSFVDFITLEFYETEIPSLSLQGSRKIQDFAKNSSLFVKNVFYQSSQIDSIKRVKDSAAKKQFQTASGIIESYYQRKEDVVEGNYSVLCSKKKRELGLE